MGKIKFSIVTFFPGGKFTQGCSISTKGTGISVALCEDCIALGEFLMLNSQCASLEVFSSQNRNPSLLNQAAYFLKTTVT